ncbi:hypothetical protein PybrP1_003111 [[Pythium] brassicae (nom. inval.)]|nr:hypothetical protein PybrP1_003111 [[Pythium] brassicae (nom. inval.)]
MAATEVAAAAKDEDAASSALQTHLQLDACDGKFLTRQEILLLELFGASSAVADGGKSALGAANGSSSAAQEAAGASGPATGASGAKSAASAALAKATAAAATVTPKRQPSTDRERVQNFLLQRQHSSGVSSAAAAAVGGGTTASSSSSSNGGAGSGANSSSAASAAIAKASPALSALERAKLVMAKKVGAATAKPLSSAGAVKRTNPLADILKGGSVVGGSSSSSASASAVSAAKRPRTTKSDKPGEIRIQGGRSAIQLPLESFLRSEDWDSATDGRALELVLPEVAFATNNTLVVHATLPARAARCAFNVSTHASLLSGAPYPGTVLYHFSPRRGARGAAHAHVQQNSAVDGRWGAAQPLSAPRSPVAFGEPFTLRLTLVPSGFLVFIEELFQDEFKHRVPIREGENLVLTVPTRDESGAPEGVVVHSVWWGHAEAPANIAQLRRGLASGPSSGGGGPRGGYEPGDRGGGYRGSGGAGRGGGGGSGGGGGGFQGAPHPYEVYVGNLPQGTSREELSFLFQYLGFETVRITARGFGFVTLRSAEDMNRAVEDLDGRDFNGMKLRVSCALPPK